jgi:phospholipid/cholesterol/gamma-HCH transport system substrate-binding protein
LVLLVGVILLAIWAYGTRQLPHQVRAVFAQAPNLYTGEDVQVDGLDAGKVTAITYSDGEAIVGIGIQDSQYWPLHQGTTVTLRFGTTIGNGTRFIQLNPGPKSNPAIPQNGIITEDRTVASVEFDQLFNIFNGATRSAFRGAIQGTANTFGSRAKQLGAGVQHAGPALASVAGFAGDLARDQQSLRQLVSSGAQVTAELAAHQAQISSLVSNAAGTFNAFAANTSGITGSLDLLPPTLTKTRATLARLDTSISHLNGLVGDLAPGAQQLGKLSADLLPALTNLRTTIPVALDTFRVGTSAAPPITRLLAAAQPFSSVVAPAFTSLAPMIGCIRPYSPEIAGLLTTWSSWTKNYDQIGHLGRLWGNAGPTSLTSNPTTPAQFTRATGQGYALIRPPGYNADQPWYLPRCDATPAGVNAANDPEAVH